jgi:death-on-curing protein
MNYLSLEAVLAIHAAGVKAHGGTAELHDLGLVESAVAQPRMTFGGEDLYPTLADKAAALGFSLTSNHGFKDGNKRVGFTAMDTFLRLNGHRIVADIDDAEAVSLAVSDHRMPREAYAEWVRNHVQPLPAD